MKKKILRLSLILLGLFILLLFLFNSKLTVSAEDKKYIQSFLNEWKLSDSMTVARRDFDSEIRFISTLQDSVVNGITHSFNPYNVLGSVKYYYDTRKGYCYDRAALLEKTLMYAGFQTRHIFIYFNNNKPTLGLTDFFRRNSSHAMMEVKTARGWMAVGTNCNWLGIKEDGSLLNIFQMRNCIKGDSLKLMKQWSAGTPFWVDVHNKGVFRIVYGLYSRHGQFLYSKPVEVWLNKMNIHSPFPDYDLRELLYNF